MPRNRIHTRDDGRYVYQVTDASGKRRYIYSSKGETKRKFSQRCDVLDQQALGTVVVDTFDQLFRHWETTHLKVHCSKADQDNTPRIYERHVKSHIGYMRISDIQRSDVYNVLTLAFKKKLSSATITKIRGCISRPFNWAVNVLGYTLIPPTANLKFSHTTKSAKRRRALSKEELERIFDAAKSSKYEKCFLLMAMLGLRPSEALGLQIRNIKEDHLEIRPPSITRYGVSNLKTATADRDIRLTSQVKEILAELKERSAFQTSEGWLFPTANKEPSMAALESAFDRIIRHTAKSEKRTVNDRIEVKILAPAVKASMYDLRHTFATNMAAKGVNHEFLKQVMGHKDIKTTFSYYVDLTDEVVDQSLEIMDKIVI